MEKVYYSLIALLAIGSICGCNKAEELESAKTTKTIVLTAFNDSETKTSLNGTDIIWTTEDRVLAYGLNNYTSTQTTVLNDGKSAKFEFSVEEDDELLYAVYPAAKAGGDITEITISIPDVQTAVANSFTDGSNVAIGNVKTDGTIHFKNIGALISFKVLNDGIESITFSADVAEGSSMTGNAMVEISEEDEVTTIPDDNKYSVTLNGSFIKENYYYAVVYPGTYSNLKIEFTRADGKTATFNSTATLELNRNDNQTIFASEILDSKWEGEQPAAYVKVTSTSDLTDGKYLIVYETGSVALDGHLTSDVASNTVAVTISDGKIAPSTEIDAAAVTYHAADGSFLGAGGKYIGHTGNSNTLNYSDSALSNEVSINSDGNAVIDAGDSYILRYNKTSGQERFRYYKGTQEAVQLYKHIGASKQNQTLSFPQESYDVVLGESFTAPTVTGAQTTVTYSSSDDEVATVDASTGAVQTLSAGEVTITATACSDDTYNEGTAEYTISIIDPDTALTTVDAIFEESEEAGNYMVTFDDWVVSGVKDNNAYVTDGTKGFIIYNKSGHGFVAGDVLSGTVNSCALTNYNGSAEFTNITSTTEGLTVTKGGLITPATFSISELSGVNTGAVISFDNLTYNGTVFTDGENEIKPFGTFITLPNLTTGAHYKVTGVYIQYGNTKEIAPRTAEDISEIEATKYTISITSGILHGFVSADKVEAAAGIEVTLTATPATGYGFDAWNVKDADNNSVTVTNNKFIMPASNVTVSATFKDVSSEYGTVVFDFSSTEGLAKLGITAPAKSAGTTLTSCSISPITISNTKDGGTVTRVWNSNGSYDLRVYSGAKLSFTSTSNVITKIQFEGTANFEGVTNLVWTGSSSTVVLDATSNSNITKITVTYGNPPVILTSLSWTGYTSSYTVGDEFTIDGTIKAIYSDGSESELETSDVSLTEEPDLTAAGTTSATISYTEDEVTVEAVANITVKTQGSSSTTGTLRITRSSFPSGTLAYNVTDAWSTTASTGETVSGDGDLYSSKDQTTMQTKNSGVSTMYHNTVAVPGSITKITMKCASGTTRTYTAYMNKTTAITNTTNGTDKGTIAPEPGKTASLSLDAADGWHYFWLNLAGGASYLEYIEIEYVTD